MAKLVRKCNVCSRVATSVNFETLGDIRIHNLTCGHTFPEALFIADVEKAANHKSLNGESLRDYQIQKGIKFLEENGLTGLLAWEMGSGKTPTMVSALWMHKDQVTPIAVFCKSKLKQQMVNQFYKWSEGNWIPQVIDSGKEAPLPGWPVYIISLDLLRNLSWLDEFEVKTVIVDECQLIKNPESKRTQAVRKVAEKAEHRIALSGTPIENSAKEYYPMLNILDPVTFNQEKRYIDNYVDVYKMWNGSGYTYKYGGIKPYALDHFREKTKHLISRVKIEEVLPDIPSINTNNFMCDLSREAQLAYVTEVNKLLDYLDEHPVKSAEQSVNILGFMQRLRHITGRAKVDHAVDFIADFLMMKEDAKFIAFVHHQDVGAELYDKMMQFCKDAGFNQPLKISADVDKDTMNGMLQCAAETAWVSREKGDRLLIASTNMSAEGLDLQQCSDAAMIEFQWNPKREEQCIGRMRRFGSTAKVVNMTYFLAEQTIDEYITEIKARKRQAVNQTMGDGSVDWSQDDMIRELLEKLQKTGRKRWSLTGN
jgi:SNF2 family DNA or RNA helicase